MTPNLRGIPYTAKNLQLFSKDLEPLNVSYKMMPDYLINDGQCIRVHYDKGSVITGANLKGQFQLVQFHFHWGSKSGIGSEHLINGKCADAELHLVHLNTKYNDVFEAMEQDDGLAVLGVFLRESSSEAPNALKPITEKFANLTNFGHQYKCTEPFDLTKMLPDLTEFVTYDGSLTTPPLKQVQILLQSRFINRYPFLLAFLVKRNFKPIKKVTIYRSPLYKYSHNEME